jgi:hypothetical protein
MLSRITERSSENTKQKMVIVATNKKSCPLQTAFMVFANIFNALSEPYQP